MTVTRTASLLAALVAAAGIVTASALAAPRTPKPPKTPTMTIDVPATVHVNKTYRIKASGYAPERLYLSVWIQTEAHGKCRKNIDGEGRHHAYPAIVPTYPPFVPVGPGKYSKKSDKLADTKANGHDYVCGYLLKRTKTNDLGPVLRVQKKIKSKP